MTWRHDHAHVERDVGDSPDNLALVSGSSSRFWHVTTIECPFITIQPVA
jgi:hypothetical protein